MNLVWTWIVRFPQHASTTDVSWNFYLPERSSISSSKHLFFVQFSVTPLSRNRSFTNSQLVNRLELWERHEKRISPVVISM